MRQIFRKEKILQNGGEEINFQTLHEILLYLFRFSCLVYIEMAPREKIYEDVCIIRYE